MLLIEVARVNAANYGVYGAGKAWLQPDREGIVVARRAVERLMAQTGLVGTVLGKVKRTTIQIPLPIGPMIWCSAGSRRPRRTCGGWGNIAYVSLWSGWVDVAFVIDAYARRILGWRGGTTMTAQLVLNGGLDQAVWTRQREGHDGFNGPVYHSNRGRVCPMSAVSGVHLRGSPRLECGRIR